ncbi:unnamed protein product [Leptidea sinapis]|uniref:Uncharacterized protein n=1 Tax=Leptidea sinapis TaxID=189913 RepID=A0A5E4Q8C5_9NEOP|nr:unnamed protein product [Leptidea sinapis]
MKKLKDKIDSIPSLISKKSNRVTKIIAIDSIIWKELNNKYTPKEKRIKVLLLFTVMPVDADLNCTAVVTPSCELKGLRTWKDTCLVRNSLFQYQVRVENKL